MENHQTHSPRIPPSNRLLPQTIARLYASMRQQDRQCQEERQELETDWHLRQQRLRYEIEQVRGAVLRQEQQQRRALLAYNRQRRQQAELEGDRMNDSESQQRPQAYVDRESLTDDEEQIQIIANLSSEEENGDGAEFGDGLFFLQEDEDVVQHNLEEQERIENLERERQALEHLVGRQRLMERRHLQMRQANQEVQQAILERLIEYSTDYVMKHRHQQPQRLPSQKHPQEG